MQAWGHLRHLSFIKVPSICLFCPESLLSLLSHQKWFYVKYWSYNDVIILAVHSQIFFFLRCVPVHSAQKMDSGTQSNSFWITVSRTWTHNTSLVLGCFWQQCDYCDDSELFKDKSLPVFAYNHFDIILSYINLILILIFISNPLLYSDSPKHIQIKAPFVENRSNFTFAWIQFPLWGNSLNGTESTRGCILVVPLVSQQQSQGKLRLKIWVIVTVFSMLLSSLAASRGHRKSVCSKYQLPTWGKKRSIPHPLSDDPHSTWTLSLEHLSGTSSYYILPLSENNN